MNINLLDNTEEFLQFKVSLLRDNSRTLFDIYCKVKNDFILFSKANYKWTLAELQELLKANVRDLYYHKRDFPLFKKFKSSIIPKVEIDHNAPPQKRLISIQKVGSDLMEALFEGEVKKEAIDNANILIDEVLNCLNEDMSSIQVLQHLANHDYYTYFHSVTMSSYACAISKKMGNPDEKTKLIGLGSLLHDIGKKEISLSIINKPGPLTPEEWEIMKNHPSMGYNLLKEQEIDPVSLDIILHHHEKLDASGYPDGLSAKDISFESQISFLSDVFSALTTNRSYHYRRTRLDAFQLIKDKMKGQYNKDIFKILVYLFSQIKTKE